jgi:hypothetical protein
MAKVASFLGVSRLGSGLANVVFGNCLGAIVIGTPTEKQKEL